MQLAPIVLFVYNRPWHAEQTLTALAANPLADQSALYIYADGPKPDAPDETLRNIEEVRKVIRKKQWCREIKIIESDVNLGLANSVINAVTEVVNKHGKVIVLEDDIVTSKFFLQFMNDSLDLYSDEPKLISIGALNFFATDKDVDDTFFIPIPDCWGWATWKDRWALFEPNAQKLLNNLRDSELIEKFNLHGAYNFEAMLIDQIKGNVSSWAIRWQAVAFLQDMLTLYPKYSVTKNIGFGTGGTHGGNDRYSKTTKFAEKRVTVKKIEVKEDPSLIRKMEDGYWKTTQPPKGLKTKLSIRKQIKYLLPPGVTFLYRKIRPHYHNSILWRGNYLSWCDAEKECSGYGDTLILEKTKKAILKVKNGEAAGERDSVLFDSVQYSWPVSAHLLKIAIENNYQLNIIDFGGSLGSSYFQNREIIPANVKISWNVVEQKNYIDIGNREIADGKLKFFYTIKEAYKDNRANVILLSSVLQYMEQPYQFLKEVIALGFDYIIIDRTAFIDDADDRITIQTVPESIYKASYPAWFFNRDKFKKYFSGRYTTLLEFSSEIDHGINLDDKMMAGWRGFVLKKKERVNPK